MKERIELNSDAARLRRREFGIGTDPPIDMFSLAANSENLTLVYYPMGERISGMCIRDGSNIVIGVNSETTYGRQRFTIAHELYHIYFHDNFKSLVCSKDLERDKDSMETEADMFASYFLAPDEAVRDFIISKLKKGRKGTLELSDIVRLEQHFGLSRQAALWRLVHDGYLAYEEANTMKTGIILSALTLGFDDTLYKPSPEEKQYAAYGRYIQLAEELKGKGIISNGKYEELLLSGFRGDMVYGPEGEGRYD